MKALTNGLLDKLLPSRNPEDADAGPRGDTDAWPTVPMGFFVSAAPSAPIELVGYGGLLAFVAISLLLGMGLAVYVASRI